MEKIDINKLKENPANPRTISKEKFALLKKSIVDFPDMLTLRPLVIDDKNIVLGGNMRLKALRDLGYKEVPIIRANELTEAQKKEFVIKDNASFGEWDMDLLANEWSDLPLEEWGIDLPFMEGKEAQDDDYEIPETIKTDIELGDLFQIGNHRLLCGDSTKKEDVERLMNGEKADMVFTDPPYNENYKSRGANEKLRKGIENDNMSDVEFDSFINLFIPNILQNIKDGASIYVCCNWKDSYPRFYFNLQKSGINISANIVWNKGSGGMGWQDYRYQYEFIIYGFKKGAKHSWYGGRTETDVWDTSRDNRNEYNHPTQKPIAIPSKAIGNSSKSGDLVLDLFGGSGSTMVACEKMNRKSYLNEFDPEYCQVIIDRMKKAFPDIKVKKL